MATFDIVLSETGLTLIAKVYNSAGTQQGADVTMTETATFVYSGTYDESGLAAGTYSEFPVVFLVSPSDVKGVGVLKVSDGVEVLDENLPNLDVAVSTRSDFDEAVDPVANVTLVDTTTTNTDMRGTDNALLAADYVLPDNATIASIDSKVDTVDNNVDAIKLKTDNLPSDPTSKTDLTIVNNNVKKASLLIPASEDLT